MCAHSRRLNFVEKTTGGGANTAVEKRTPFTRPIITGTSTSGPITAANAAPELIPKTETATAIASSKLFDAAVNARVVVFDNLLPACPYQRDQEHDHKVDQQRHSNPQNIQRQADNVRRLLERTSRRS